MEITFYKISDLETNYCYIGSTNNIKLRFNKHKSDYNKYLKNNLLPVCKSVEIFKNNNYKLEILEVIKYNNFDELKNRYEKEKEYLAKEPNCINKNYKKIKSQ
jgi:predicted GIY-YIG superfamily endonuclease